VKMGKKKRETRVKRRIVKRKLARRNHSGFAKSTRKIVRKHSKKFVKARRMSSEEQMKVFGSKDAKVDIESVQKYSRLVQQMKDEVSKAVSGQRETVDSLFISLLADGHVLLEGVPGLAKTLLVRSIAAVSGCEVKRVQFTVDLLPTDITGITTYNPGKGFETLKGPIFTNLVIADEINRSPPKTQSAMIEAMQEKQVTIGRDTYKLPSPFLVMATQNPLEQSGVYSLPEAQVDRFLFKVVVGYPKYHEEEKIIEQNMTLRKFEDFGIRALTSPEEILKMQSLVKQVYLDEKVKKYILDIVQKTRARDFRHGELIEWGCSPRASIALYIAAKAKAFVEGRNYVIPEDVKRIAHSVLRHRIILSYRARSEGINSDVIINQILSKEVKVD
jgi:MoxR-like ATPase